MHIVCMYILICIWYMCMCLILFEVFSKALWKNKQTNKTKQVKLSHSALYFMLIFRFDMINVFKTEKRNSGLSGQWLAIPDHAIQIGHELLFSAVGEKKHEAKILSLIEMYLFQKSRNYLSDFINMNTCCLMLFTNLLG